MYISFNSTFKSIITSQSLNCSVLLYMYVLLRWLRVLSCVAQARRRLCGAVTSGAVGDRQGSWTPGGTAARERCSRFSVTFYLPSSSISR